MPALTAVGGGRAAAGSAACVQDVRQALPLTDREGPAHEAQPGPLRVCRPNSRRGARRLHHRKGRFCVPHLLCTPANAAALSATPSCSTTALLTLRLCADLMDLDPDLRKAIAAATGKDIESIEKAAASKGWELSLCACMHLSLGLPPAGVAGPPSRSVPIQINSLATDIQIIAMDIILRHQTHIDYFNILIMILKCST